MNIQEMIQKYVISGYSDDDATSKVSQDIILTAISKSRYSKNITVKGGVVLHNLSNDMRRATRDLDLDFIKYSLEDNSIRNFVNELTNSINEIDFKITNDIIPLHHQDYRGKRVFIQIKDKYNNIIDTKLDIGVHKLFEIEQEEYMFDFNTINLGANLLINSPEQIFTEKLKSLLKFNVRSTRYKDIFDFYYLITNSLLDMKKLDKCFDILIYRDPTMKEKNITEIIKKFSDIANSRFYKRNLMNPKYNWLDIDINSAIESIMDFLERLAKVEV